MRRMVVLIACGALLLNASAAFAAGAKPSNDLPKGAIAVPDSLPQTVTQDTSAATVSSKEPGGCFAGFSQATVWYTFTPVSDEEILVDPSASSYLVGVTVFDGAANDSQIIACGAGGASGAIRPAATGGPANFFASSGTTYYVMFADIDGDATNGGTLSATFELAPPPITVTLTVDPTATLSRSGVVTVTGTLTCDQEANYAEVDPFLSQTVGRFVIQGYGFAPASCGTTATSWSADVTGSNGVFGGGSIEAQVSAYACTINSCSEAFVETTLKVRH